MSPLFEKVLGWSTSNPKRLFLIDGVGALTSAVLLGLVLVRFENVFGIPVQTLRFLAAIPCFFAAYDLVGYLNKGNATALIKGIAGLNIAYCLLSLGLIIYHLERVKVLGWAYVILEIMIVSCLALVELRTARLATGGGTGFPPR